MQPVIDQKQLENINLKPNAGGQRVVAPVARFTFKFPRRTSIIIENKAYIPVNRSVIFVMNHTDHCNYVPFMLQLFYEGYRPISPWVKGKYYENPLMARFFDWTNNIPLPSRGYVLSKDFQLALNRLPAKTEYRLLRDLVDGKTTLQATLSAADEGMRRFLTTPHGDFDPQAGHYGRFIEARYNAMMRRVAAVSEEALLSKNLSLLIFPEGTRSVRLTEGHIGVAQIALKTGAPVVPVGCNGSNKCFPGNSPWPKSGTITYRVGRPLAMAAGLAPFAIDEPFEPFSAAAEAAYQAQFRGATDLIMARINSLLNPEHQFSPKTDASLRAGAGRFV